MSSCCSGIPWLGCVARVRRLTTACSRRPRQSSNLHTQICRLPGARLMLAVRRVANVLPQSWSYAPSVSESRISRFARYPSYEDVLSLLDRKSRITDYFLESARASHLRGLRRASFRLRLPRYIYDAFFNSPYGYRAQYALSPEIGACSNRMTIDRLIPKLTRHRPAIGDGHERLLRSLRSKDAKIWIDELEVESQLGGHRAQIAFPPWVAGTESGVGLLAPIGHNLEVKGGWLNEAGEEVRDPHKARRSEEIHEAGYS